MTDLQRAGMWKRISAFLFDLIFFSILAVLSMYLLSNITGYDSYNETLQRGYERIGSRFGIDLFISDSEYSMLDGETQKLYTLAFDELNADEETVHAYTMMMQLTLLITSAGILFSMLITEILIPVLLKDGRTVGKKIFGLAVMRTEGYRITGVALFIRSLLGKYAIEVMIPVCILLMIYFNAIGLLGALILLGILILQLVLVFSNDKHLPIHDRLADTVTVDYASQMIFDTREDMIAYKQKAYAEKIAREAD